MATDITSIPESLFAPCGDTEDFAYTFANCDQLTSVGDIFKSNTKAIDFTEVFGYIGNTAGKDRPPIELPIPPMIFGHSADIKYLCRWIGKSALEWDKTGDPPVIDFYVSSPNVVGGLTAGAGAFVSVPQGLRSYVEDEEESAKIEGKYYRYVGPIVRVHVPAGSETETTFREATFKDEDYEEVSSPGQWLPNNIYSGAPFILVLE